MADEGKKFLPSGVAVSDFSLFTFTWWQVFADLPGLGIAIGDPASFGRTDWTSGQNSRNGAALAARGTQLDFGQIGILRSLFLVEKLAEKERPPSPLSIPPAYTSTGVFFKGRKPWLPGLCLPHGSQHSSPLVTLLLLLSGQCPNPGPPAQPCGVCGSNVAWGFWPC